MVKLRTVTWSQIGRIIQLERVNMEKYKIITIAREFCAGGTSIAKGLSERLQIPWYDRDFARITAEKSGYTYEEVMIEGEEISGFSSALNSFLNNAAPYTSSFDAIFNAQKEEIVKLSESPCIVIGRCGNYVCKEAGINSFDIFLYADMEKRIARYAELNDGQTTDQKAMEKKDSKRENYYKMYTGHGLGNYRDYNICLDTGTIGYAKCVDMLATMLKEQI